MNMGFHSEWKTISNHRVLIHCRHSYPREEYWDEARDICFEMSFCKDSSLICIMIDESNGDHKYYVATTSSKEYEELKKRLNPGVVQHGNTVVDLRLLEPSPDVNKDSYCHVSYLHEAWKKVCP